MNVRSHTFDAPGVEGPGAAYSVVERNVDRDGNALTFAAERMHPVFDPGRKNGHQSRLRLDQYCLVASRTRRTAEGGGRPWIAQFEPAICFAVRGVRGRLTCRNVIDDRQMIARMHMDRVVVAGSVHI